MKKTIFSAVFLMTVVSRVWAAGCAMAMATSWFKFGKPEIGMSLNGARMSPVKQT